MDNFLKSEDFALDHAHALEDVAKYLMEQKEYKKARPYAELAAQSWAGWAMLSAAAMRRGDGRLGGGRAVDFSDSRSLSPLLARVVFLVQADRPRRREGRCRRYRAPVRARAERFRPKTTWSRGRNPLDPRSTTQGSTHDPGTLPQGKPGNFLWSIIGPRL